MSNEGQSLLEFNLVTLLLLIPAGIGGSSWAIREYWRFQCAHQAFKMARASLIQTHRHSNQQLDCGHGIKERVELASLEEIGADAFLDTPPSEE